MRSLKWDCGLFLLMQPTAGSFYWVRSGCITETNPKDSHIAEQEAQVNVGVLCGLNGGRERSLHFAQRGPPTHPTCPFRFLSNTYAKKYIESSNKTNCTHSMCLPSQQPEPGVSWEVGRLNKAPYKPARQADLLLLSSVELEQGNNLKTQATVDL